MKIKRKLLTACLGFVALVAGAFALASCSIDEGASERLKYTLSDEGTYYVASGIGYCKDTEIVISSNYNDLPVTSISNYAFYNCTSLTSVVIPDSITYIGYAAFRDCTSLTSLVIGNGVTSIDAEAFLGCKSLTRVSI